MNNIDKHYQALLQDILDNGVIKSDRTGTGTISVFGRQIRHKMSDGFPLLTTKKMAWKSIVTELLWFLRGDTNIKFLLDYDCHIWDGDAYKRYANSHRTPGNPNGKTFLEQLDSVKPMQHSKETFIDAIKTDDEFAKQWGDLGPIYGKQWRQWQGWMQYKKDDGSNGFGSLWYDQILRLVHSLKTEPDSRRLMVSAWNVAELDQMVLPPCHYGFQVYTRELSDDERIKLYEQKTNTDTSLFPVLRETLDFHNVPTRAISLMWNQRSVDTFLGLPFNIASYALLLEIIAKEVNMIPEDLIGNLGDVHLYKNHIEQAKEQISREPYELPTIQITERNWYQHEKVKENLGPKTFKDIILSYRPDCFELIGYESHPKIKAPLSN
jgi:thymidylate synthase